MTRLTIFALELGAFAALLVVAAFAIGVMP